MQTQHQFGLIGFGRMGQSIFECLKNTSNAHCSGIKVRHIKKEWDENVELKKYLTTDVKSLAQSADVLIDFSTLESLEGHVQTAIDFKKPLLIGVTGLTQDHEKMLHDAEHTIPICLASNTSLSIALMGILVQKAAEILDDTYDIEIFEAHHRNKADAPSGTALTLGQASAKGRGDHDFHAHMTYPHHYKREKGHIGFSVARGGGITSEHTVSFYGDDDVLSFSHRSLNRSLYAKGAIKLAELLAHQPAGFYFPQDLLLKRGTY